jgi:hypothetical protein
MHFKAMQQKNVNGGLTVYLQFLGTLSQRLGIMITRYTQLYTNYIKAISS